MSRWIPIIVIADFVLLPMLHFNGIPFKFGYLILLIYGAWTIPRSPFAVRFTILFGSLALITFLGWLNFSRITGAGDASNTATFVTQYAIFPFAVGFGVFHAKQIISFIPNLIIIYFLVNMFVILNWSSLIGTSFGDFYFYTEDFLGPGTIAVRAGGLHQNPHVSALFMTMLYLMLFIGIKYRVVNIGRPIVITALLLAIAFPVILESRSEAITAVFISLAVVIVLVKNRTLSNRLVMWTSIFVLAAFIVTSLLIVVLNIERDPTRRFVSGVTKVIDAPLNPEVGLGRPVRYWNSGVAPERLQLSPYVGTGGASFGYHNDWLIVLVSSGFIGFVIFLLIVFQIARLHVVFLLPLMIAGLTNSAFFAPQHLTLLAMALGVTAAIRAAGAVTTERTTLDSPAQPDLRNQHAMGTDLHVPLS